MSGSNSKRALLEFIVAVLTLLPAAWALAQAQQAKLTADDGAPVDFFGNAVAISGDTAVVGAFFDDEAGTNAGAAYVFVRSEGVWAQQAKLTAADAAPGDWFSYGSVAISGDTAVVGAFQDDNAGGTDAGAAYVFARAGGVWTQQAKLTAPLGDAAPLDKIGESASIDADTLIIGARRDDNAGGTDAGAAYVFVRSGATWTQQAKLTAPYGDAESNHHFGSSVSIRGDTAVVGAAFDDDYGADTGAAYVFVRSDGVWMPQAKLIASGTEPGDNFGDAVSVDGDTVLVGVRFDDNAGGTNAGAAYVFVRFGGLWTQQAQLTAPPDDAAPMDYFGVGVSLDGDTAIVGASGDDNAGGETAGAAYVFVRSGAVWTQVAKLTADDAAEGDWFSFPSVALSGDTAVVGSWLDDNAGGEDAGSAYVFLVDCGGPVDLADHAALVACTTGPGGGVGLGCAPADFDQDNDVDLADFARLQEAFTGCL